MAKPALQDIQEQSTEQGTFQISSNATDFFISIRFINEKAQQRNVRKVEFKKITFDSTYKSPFVIGSLQLLSDKILMGMDTAEIKGENENSQYENIATGGEFLHIKIEQQSTATRCERETLVDRIYITKNMVEGLVNNEKTITYYFADVEYGALMYQKFPWSTNDYVSWGPDHSEWGADENNPYEALDVAISEGVSQFSREQCGIKVSDAIKHLLRRFCSRTGGMEATTEENLDWSPIINEQEWDESSSKIMYTLPQNTAPMVGLFDLMSKYVSKIHGDMGILLYYNGMFSLRSLTNIINDAIDLNTMAESWSDTNFKRKFAGVIKIETDDIRMHYSKRQSHSIFADPDIQNLLIPVNIQNVTFHKKQPTAATDKIVDHTITSYDVGRKLFKLNNKKGSVQDFNENFSIYMTAFPDANSNDGELAPNVNKTDLTKPNKERFFNLHTASDQDSSYGKIMLQQKILDNSDKVTINLTGVGSKNNWMMTGGKFIGIEVAGEKLDKFMENVPGFWFILRNITTLQEGQFNTKLVCSKIDKFERGIGTRAAGAS